MRGVFHVLVPMEALSHWASCIVLSNAVGQMWTQGPFGTRMFHHQCFEKSFKVQVCFCKAGRQIEHGCDYIVMPLHTQACCVPWLACVSVANPTQAGSNHLKAQADFYLKDVVLQNECINAAPDCLLAADTVLSWVVRGGGPAWNINYYGGMCL